MNIAHESIDVLQDSSGVVTARVKAAGGSFVIKYFSKTEFRREIENYNVLSSIGVPTAKIISKTENAILMEDIEESEIYRLGIKEDLNDQEIAVSIAKWYKKLHEAGYRYIENNDSAPLYDENELITLANIERIKQKTGTAENSIWGLIESNFDIIESHIKNARRTLTYNDFYYTNLAAARDKSSAFMFDYNLLGKSYAYADIRNVCSMLSEVAKEAFLAEYGSFDETEQIIDDVASTLVSLCIACDRAEFPSWAEEELDKLENDYIDKVIGLLML